MKVIIAEKPSVARQIASIVGATIRKEGYLEGNGYTVTWAFGHLVGLAMPESYGFKGFHKENLPILPEVFRLEPRSTKSGKEYKPDPGTLKQLKVIKALFEQAERIIVATDAGREGELIFRYIYQYLDCDKPFDRLWINSLTDQAIREGLRNIRPGSEYDNLYLSARARSEADWIVGINASQALAIAAGRGVWSLGRVRLRRWLWYANGTWKIGISPLKPSTGLNSIRRKTPRHSAHCLSTNTLRRMKPQNIDRMFSNRQRFGSSRSKAGRQWRTYLCCTTLPLYREMPTDATASRPKRH